MKRQILSTNPFSAADSEKECNTDCIVDWAEVATGKPGAEGFIDFMKNPGKGQVGKRS